MRERCAVHARGTVWAVLATALQGKGIGLSSSFKCSTDHATPKSGGIDIYKVEPYVVAADVYTAKGHLGRGGWTWYTGSASWMYRVALESILGFQQRGDMLFIEPCIPASWKEFTIEYRVGASTYEITIENPDGLERGSVELRWMERGGRRFTSSTTGNPSCYCFSRSFFFAGGEPAGASRL